MTWILNALIAIGLMGVSDLLRKATAEFKDPFFGNLAFQLGAFSTTLILFLIFSRTFEGNPRLILYSFIGGGLIATFTFFSLRALSVGPGLSVVLPTMRIGGVALTALLGIVLLREKATMQTVAGIIMSSIGIYLLFSNK